MGPTRTDKCVRMLLVLFAVIFFPLCATGGMITEVTVNKSVLLNLLKPSERVSIATPAIAELVVISPTQLQINGTKIGATSLIVWEKGGKTSFFDIRVKADSRELEARNLEERIKEIAPNDRIKDTIKVEYVNDTIVLSGKATNERTIARVILMAKLFAAKGSEKESKATEKESKGSEKESKGSEKNNMSGEKESKGSSEADNKNNDRMEMDSKSIDQLVQMTPQIQDELYKIINLIQLDEPQQILLEVRVAQVDKTAMKSLGISAQIKGDGFNLISNMAGTLNGPWIGTINPSATLSVNGSIGSTALNGLLKALITRNLAKMLAEPNLLVKSGQVGSFLAGKKYYLPIVTNNTTDTKEITVGVKLNFKPEVLENGLISLKIDPAEMSSIVDGTLLVNGNPIIDTREIRTSVQLKDGESLVLAGLLQEETIKSMSKMPLLGDLPILGALFRSTQEDRKEKELVFFITPRLKIADPPGTIPDLPTGKSLTPEQEKWMQMTPEQEKELQWMPLGK